MEPNGQNDVHKEIESQDNNVYKSTTILHEYIKKKGINKYRHELQHLLPIRNDNRNEKEMPIDTAGCFSYVYFSWMTPLVWRSFRKGLKPSDTYQCSILDSSRVNGARIANIWEEESRNVGLHNTSLQRVLYRFVRTRVLIASIFYLICLITGYLSSTYFLKKMLDHIENQSEPTSKGIQWSVVLFVCELCRASSFAIMYAISIRTSIRVSSGLNSILYNKLLTSRSFTNKTVGEMVNLFANDTSKIFNMIYILPLTIGGPVVILVTIIYTWYLLGPFSLVGVLIFIIIFGLQFLTAKIQSYYRKKVMIKTDERVSIMTELLTYIKLIKLYAWERPFSELVFEHREMERKLLEKCQYLQCLSTSLALMTPMITTIASILAYTLAQQGNLTAAKAFTLVMVNYIAAHGIRSLPMYIRDIVNGRIALSRIEKVLQYDDKDNYIILTSNALNSVELKNATLAWDSYSPVSKKLDKQSDDRAVGANVGVDEDTSKSGDNVPQRSNTLSATCLFDINLEIARGKCIGIIGSVGSGKTALLRSLLGQMRLINGKVSVRGLSAYVSQEPWILNATVRDNITFGYSFDKKRYYESVNCCGLTNDISSLPASDLTEVGERGVTLSGGQKQRIALARAYYSDRDIYLLDDPLSSVDRNVGKHIFNHCIRGALKGKTIFLVTHQIEYLEAMDVVLLMRDGYIVNSGTHNELYDSDQEYKQLVQLSKIDFEHKNLDKSEEVNDLNEVRFSSPDWGDVQPLSLSKSGSESSLPEKLDSDFRRISDHSSIFLSTGRLINEEHIEKGNISFDSYKHYIDACGGLALITFVISWIAFLAISSSFSNWWLGYWISQGNGSIESTGPDGMHGHDIILDNPDLSYYQTIYGLSVVVVLSTSLALGYMFTKITITASNTLHNQVFTKIFQSPMSFYDTVPIGRILNIFTRDTDEIDTQLPTTLDGFLQRLMIVICNLFIILIIFPWFLLPFVGIAVLFWLVYNMFRGAMRNLKRLENSSRSPIYSHIAATIEGLPIIKAFNKQNDFIYKFSELIDFQSSPNFLYYCSMRWLSTRMDILCVFISFFACILSIIHKESVGAAFAGLALVLSMQLSGLFQFVIRLGVDAETRFTSVERIYMYTQQLNLEEANTKDVKTESIIEWPTRGRISFRDVTMRYRSGLPLALKNITFDISPQEKIGIVGRTGAGKSSITAALFRLVEISSGTIHIDGVNIANIPLHDLRSRISIIPQDPILFRGSIRRNLDPFNQYKTQVIMDCLECVRMKFKVNNLKQGINTYVNENSATFSAGERQLLCMARALLKKSKILILDEATSSMDGETEKTIHDTIIEVFKECTVLNIAHRIQSIIDCDRIMVMHNGNIVEFDKPSILMSNPLSLFKQMISTQIDSLIEDEQ